jgi:hypothetical protein
MTVRWRYATLCGLVTLCAGPAAAQGLETSVELTYSHTVFAQGRDDLNNSFDSISGTLSLGGDLSERWSTNFALYARDMPRSGNDKILELNEGWFQYSADRFGLTVGVDVVAWPTLEFFQTTDIINQRDFSSVERDQRKIGQPMIRAEYYAGDVLIEAYVLPRFTQPLFPGTASRFGNPLPVLETAAFDDEDGRNQPAFATSNIQV